MGVNVGITKCKKFPAEAAVAVAVAGSGLSLNLPDCLGALKRFVFEVIKLPKGKKT